MAPGELARTDAPTAAADESTGSSFVHGVAPVESPIAGESRVPTLSGRISEASDVLADDRSQPFSPSQLGRIDEALTAACRETGLLFTLWVGELGANSRDRAEELHASLGDRAADSVLVAVSPGERVVEVVTGDESHRRVDDNSAKLAVMSMVASFKESDLVGGMVEGLRMMADQAGAKHHH